MSRPAPVAPARRIAALDALRGFAVCGILLINIPQTLEMFRAAGELPAPLRLFALGRFYPIFYLLFGIGFGLFLRSAERRTGRPLVPMARRLAALAVFGVLLHLIQPGEVLLPFAVAGALVLLPASLVGPRDALVTGVALVVFGWLAGAGGFGLLPGVLAIGFALARWDVPRTLPGDPFRLAAVLAVAAGAALAAVLVLAAGPPESVGARVGLLLSASMSAAYAAAFLLLLRTPLGPAVSAVLAPMGRMALTNYVTAAMIFVPAGAALGLRHSSAWGTAMLLAAAILVVQAVWSRLWLAWFQQGPLEWVWRCVTYWQILPIRNPRPGGSAGPGGDVTA
ncbi:DUF418 domain-containing protein [Actinomadura flavalba]|uniref:DUF418 domain-containing protein n=1 Tax=Actinomadura flavalba TaxID=1120938 RepID=UPI000376B890|nr:DUF418 domain-containing protein [Actinomadura flavalba]